MAAGASTEIAHFTAVELNVGDRPFPTASVRSIDNGHDGFHTRDMRMTHARAVR